MPNQNECVACGRYTTNQQGAFFMPFIAHRAMNVPWLEITKQKTGLRDIPNGYAYIHTSSVFCNSCGHLGSGTRFSNEQMERLYKNYRDEKYTSLRDQYEPGYRARSMVFEDEYPYGALVEDFLLKHLKNRPKSILDWGGDSGINTPFKNTLEVHHVFDISNVHTIEGASAVTKEEIVNANYELVVCQHVLEHLPYPCQNLVDIILSLQSKPFFYFEVPHESIIRKTPKGQFPNKMHWHEHINFFSEQSLGEFVTRCGLEPIIIQSLDVSTPQREDYFILQCIAR